MITHKVIDLVYHGDENNVVMNGSLEECNSFVESQHDTFTYEVQPLLKNEVEFLNLYENMLSIGNGYLNSGNLNTFK